MRSKQCCLVPQDLQRATALFSEMVRCGVERNVHTYTALVILLATWNSAAQSGQGTLIASCLVVASICVTTATELVSVRRAQERTVQLG